MSFRHLADAWHPDFPTLDPHDWLVALKLAETADDEDFILFRLGLLSSEVRLTDQATMESIKRLALAEVVGAPHDVPRHLKFAIESPLGEAVQTGSMLLLWLWAP